MYICIIFQTELEKTTHCKDVWACVLREVLSGSSKIQHHITFLLTNLAFKMPIKLYSIKICDKIPIFHLINIRWRLCFVTEYFIKKIIKFSLLKSKQYCWIEFLISMQFVKRYLLLCEMFNGDPKSSFKSFFMNAMAVLWHI